jgi:hypothetical protein
MGEAVFATEQSRPAKHWIAENHGQFAIVTLRRFVLSWNGLPRLAMIEAREQFKDSLFLASSRPSIAELVWAIENRIHGVFLFRSLRFFIRWFTM